MKTPIKPEDIRAGDSIRVEWTRSQCGSPRALEYVAPHNGTGMRKKMSATEYAGAAHFLLHRPAPKVDLPTEPTLGWATNRNLGGTELRWWHLDDRGDRLRATGEAWGWKASEVTAFTPAVAVPKDALDRLRRTIDGAFDVPGDSDEYRLDTREEAIRELLAAVDSANGSDR